MNRVRRDTPEFRKWERIWIKRDRVELVGRRVLAGRTTNEISATGSRRSRLEGKFVLMEERRDLGGEIETQSWDSRSFLNLSIDR